MATQTQPITFTKAVRRAVPILIGVVGPSGTGKTFSALRLAEGMRRVIGGRIKVVDTEHGRALHYADYFDFDHFAFDPPYSSLRYLEVLRAAASTPGPVVVDSMSHEHSGEGGYIDLHDSEVQRLLTCGFRSEYAANVPAWAVPAKNRQKLIDGIITMGLNAVFCFRAKEKVDMNSKDENGKTKVGNLGWMPIAGDAFVFEMTAKCLLLPGADGVPTWNPEFPGEKAMAKKPIQFKDIFDKQQQLSEEIGERLAKWATGGKQIEPTISLSKEWYAKCSHDQFDELEKLRAAKWSTMNDAAKKSCKADSDAAKARLGPRPVSPPPPPPPVEQAEENLDAEPPPEQEERYDGRRRNPNYIEGVSLPEEEFIPE